VANRNGWVRRAFKLNLGRLVMMVPGLLLLSFGANKYVPMSDGEFRTAVAGSCGLILVGYLLPLIKTLRAGKDGILVETHDRVGIEESREAAVELSEEVQSAGGASVRVDETIDAARFFAADRAIAALLVNTDTLRLHLYLMDAEVGGLVPVFEDDNASLHSQAPWIPGVGVVGKAYASGAFILAVGAEASDGTHGLSQRQQEQHPDLSAVAAMPVVNSRGSVVAVLSASERGVSSPLDLESIYTRESMSVVADGCARVLIDLLGWFADDV
jgi:hypothetical protein